MAGNAIGTGAIVLSANADGVAPGLAEGEKAVDTWKASVTSKLASFGKTVQGGIASAVGTVFGGKGMLSGLQGLGGNVTTALSGWAAAAKGALSNAGAGIGFALGGPIGAAIGTAVGGAVGQLGETVAGALASPFEKVDAFAKLVKRAGVFGIDASQFQGLNKVLERAGLEGEMVDTVFAKLGNTLSKAATGDMAAEGVFKRLGLNAKELAGQSLDQTFLAIATAIQKAPTPAEQASLAIAAFGRAGAALLPELQKGGAGIQEFIDGQKKMGAVLSTSQLKAAADASKAWKGAKNAISAAWDGLVNRATIIAAPIIEFAGKAVSRAFALTEPVFDWVGRGVGAIADIARAVFDQLGSWFEQGVEWVKGWGNQLGAFTGKWPTVQTVVVEVFRTIGMAAALAWDTVKLGAGVIAVAAGAFVQYGGSIISVFRTLVDLLKKLPDDVRPAWADKFIEGVDRADDKVKELGKGLKEWGADAVTSWGSSARKFSDWLDRALAPKKPKVDPTKPVGGAAADTGPKVWQPAKLAGAVEQGTKEAYEISAKALYGDFVKAEDVHKENGAKLDKGNDILEQINSRLAGLEGSFGSI